MVAIGGMSITSSGVITFAGGQTFAGNGSGLTSLTGAQVTGTVPSSVTAATANNALLLNGASTYARTDQVNSFTIGTQAIQTGAAGTVGLAVQGASAQTANLQEWRNSAGTAVASVSASGVFSGNGSALTNLSGGQLVDQIARIPPDEIPPRDQPQACGLKLQRLRISRVVNICRTKDHELEVDR